MFIVEKMEDMDYLKHNRKLIFVVDMINGFVNEGNLADTTIKRIVPNIIEHLKENDSIFIQDAHDINAQEFTYFPKHCIKGTPESDIISELQPFVTKTLLKNSTNAFHVLDKEILNHYDEFIICGCCSDICILHFALSLKTYFDQHNINKNVVIHENSIATFYTSQHDSKKYQAMAISLMELAGIIVKK